MNKIQDFLKRKGIEDKIVDYDETNEPLTPSYIIEEWEKEQLRIGGVVKSSCDYWQHNPQISSATSCKNCGKEKWEH